MIDRSEFDTSRKNAKAEFAAIYQAAKALDKAALLSLKQNNHYLNIKDDNQLFTPAGLLAREKNHAAVLLLIELGADAGMAAMGAASVGDVQFAELLRKRHGASICSIARGAAMSGDSNYAHQLQAQYRGIEEDLIFGYAVRSALYKDSQATLERNNIISALLTAIQKLEMGSPVWLHNTMMMQSLAETYAFGMALGSDLSECDNDDFLQSTCSLAEFLRKYADTNNQIALKDDPLYRRFIDGAVRGLAAKGAFKAISVLGVTADDDLQRWYFKHSIQGSAASADILMRSFGSNYEKSIATENALANGHINSVLENIEQLLPGIEDVQLQYEARNKIIPAIWLHKAALHSCNVELFRKFTTDQEFAHTLHCKNENISILNLNRTLGDLGFISDQSGAAEAIRFLSEISNDFYIVKKAMIAPAMMGMIKRAAMKFSEDHVIHILSFMNPVTLKTISEFKLDKDYPECAKHIRIACKINHFMLKYDFDFDQAREFVLNKDFRNGLSAMIFKPLVSFIPFDVNIKFLMKLTSLQHGSIKDMLMKYRYKNQSAFLAEDKSLWWHQRKSIKQELESEVRTPPELHGFFTRKAGDKNSTMVKAVDRHIKRL